MEEGKYFGQNYKGQSYEEWSKDVDEMDVETDGCLAFYIVILFFILMPIVSWLSDKYGDKDKPKTEQHGNLPSNSSQFP